MISNKTYYECLEISESASAKEIKLAYRKLIKKWHPDLHPGDEYAIERTQEINEAYDVLSDQVKKAEYDKELAVKRPFNVTPRDKYYGVKMTYDEYVDNVVNEADDSWNVDFTQNESTDFNAKGYAEYLRSTRPEREEKKKIKQQTIFIVLPLSLVIIVGFFAPGVDGFTKAFLMGAFLIVAVSAVILLMRKAKKRSQIREAERAAAMAGFDSLVEIDDWFEDFLIEPVPTQECRKYFFALSVRGDRHLLKRFEQLGEEDRQKYSEIIDMLKLCIEYREDSDGSAEVGG